jgi:hypothetical protein
VLGEHDINEQQLHSSNGAQENVKSAVSRSSLSIVVPRSSEKVDVQVLMPKSTVSTSLRGLNHDWVNCIAELDNLNMYVTSLYSIVSSHNFSIHVHLLLVSNAMHHSVFELCMFLNRRALCSPLINWKSPMSAARQEGICSMLEV